jgi:ribonucleoside-diphosphate reductase beta chain
MALTDHDLSSSTFATAGATALAPSPAPAPAPRPMPTITGRPASILDPGFNLTLRPMKYPAFYDMFRDAIKNTWTVEEIDFSDDLVDLDRKLLPAEKHLINRLVAFFATRSTTSTRSARRRSASSSCST